MDSIYDRSITGWPVNVEGRLTRKVWALSRHRGFHVKIGITNRPKRRWCQSYGRKGWSEMHLLYVSNSHHHVCRLEKRLIERCDQGLVSALSWYYNAVGGGGGRKP